MELGGQKHLHVGHVKLLPLTVGLGSLAASLPALLVMCQAWNSSGTAHGAHMSSPALLFSGRITPASFPTSVCTDLF